MVVRFDVECDRSAAVPLPIYASALHRVQVSGQPREQPCVEVDGVPAVCGISVRAGASTVDVRIPTLGRALRAVVSRQRPG